jgi:hypothetical protein
MEMLSAQAEEAKTQRAKAQTSELRSRMNHPNLIQLPCCNMDSLIQFWGQTEHVMLQT